MVTYTSARTLEVSLPRFRLSFYVNADWELECRSIPGYVIDKSQSCGTMFGLTNKLILRPGPTSSEDSLLPRRVIIPEGEVSFRKYGDFMCVSINTDEEQHVRWHEYTIDTDLRCLTSNTSLGSKLYLCYLHALTSHCLPDPLLGHTGTEEALSILQSASCRSFQRLNIHEAKLLELIGNLTPEREYYPRHLQSMATVKWNDLPTLSQHHDFFRIVCLLFGHARALEDLYDQPVAFDTSNRNQSLLNRAASRNKSYYPSDLQNLDRPSSLVDDVIYRSRDVSDLGATEHVAFQTTWSIWNGRPSLDRGFPSLWDLMNSWGPLGSSDSTVSSRYSQDWLKFDAARDWFAIYDLCWCAVYWGDRNSKIELCFSLSAAAYSKSKYSNIVPFLIIFALDKRCCDLLPPDRSYTLSDGLAPQLTRLEGMVSGSALDIYSTPANTLDVRWYEKRDIYDATIRRESATAAEAILRHWPRYQYVDLPQEWFDKSDFNRGISEYSQSISRNIRLEKHVKQLQDVLQGYGDVVTHPAVPYMVSPQFIISHSKAPFYSLHDVLMSRTNVSSPPADGEPSRHYPFPPTVAAAEVVPPLASSASLENLIEELRNAPQPMLQVYGHELKKSHHELLSMRQHGSLLARGAVHPHNMLLVYHYECSHEKEQIFSEILAALEPSHNVEKTNGIAGLWPRITPRSLLRQLTRDRIGTLPSSWRSLITRYATSLLRYRHSLRLLELSLGQKHQELLRETDAIQSDILAESTPDWLLVQVRPLCCYY